MSAVLGPVRKIVGTGGIGKGLFFRFRENRLLGRNESRMADLTDARDYCKLHIVFHYLATLLVPEIAVIPIGAVGRDAYGEEMLNLMREAGMDTSCVEVLDGSPTMLSVCFQYPDTAGGNITACNSASSKVTDEFVRDRMRRAGVGKDTIVAALPEVPLRSRIAMLSAGKAGGAFCAATVSAGEAVEFRALKGPSFTNLLALNGEEAAAFAGLDSAVTLEEISLAADRILADYPHLLLFLTAGVNGSMIACSDRRIRFGALPGVRAVNTGGAGDAGLAGFLAGLLRCEGDLTRAGQCAMTAAGMSVECPDSIDRTINWQRIMERGREAGFYL